MFCWVTYMSPFGLTDTLSLCWYFEATSCGTTRNISNPASYPALAEMLTLHRVVMAVGASIWPPMLNHVVSDLVGLRAHMPLHWSHRVQWLSLCTVSHDLWPVSVGAVMILSVKYKLSWFALEWASWVSHLCANFTCWGPLWGLRNS